MIREARVHFPTSLRDWASLISRCSSSTHLRQIQSHLTTSGLLSATVFLHNSLIRALSRLPSSTSASHSALLYSHLLRLSLLPDSHTFPPLFKSLSLLPFPLRPFARSAHAHVIKLGFLSLLFVSNSLIHFLSFFTPLSDAERLLREAPYVDAVSFNSLLSGYVRAGDLASARKVFDEMPERSSASWSAMICGYVQSGRSREALGVFSLMQAQGIPPDDSALVGVLTACAHLGVLEEGKWVHGYLNSNGRRVSVFLGSSLIEMYVKCGELVIALEIFNGMREKNLLVWTTMIKGLAMHGHGLEALHLFSEMQRSGLMPDDIAFIGALCACTHSGLVEKGQELFDLMVSHYRIKPKIEHYGCMVDLLARNGQLGKARDLIESMPMEPDALIWGALLAGCRFHKDAEVAEYVVNKLLRLEPDNGGVYVLLANVYAVSGKHDKARSVRSLMNQKGLVKIPGCSLLEMEGTVHQFIVGDTSHPRMKEILEKWDEIEGRIRLAGYVPDKKEVLLDIEEEEKENALARHSEKLAIAYALMGTAVGVAIRIVKNLRVCTDCHHVTKLISMVYGREILVRDRTRFHLFKDGICSCNDYW